MCTACFTSMMTKDASLGYLKKCERWVVVEMEIWKFHRPTGQQIYRNCGEADW